RYSSPFGVICLHRGVLSMKPICNKYGSTTSSIVATSSPTMDASVESPTGRPWNDSIRLDKSFRSRISRPYVSTQKLANIASHSSLPSIDRPIIA
ncbi:MAG: hypothetical protein QG561_123, partial [Patescibacteria group bacterium]|nr:hypothetical protein [Patescibacteria group bacterium]